MDQQTQTVGSEEPLEDLGEIVVRAMSEWHEPLPEGVLPPREWGWPR